MEDATVGGAIRQARIRRGMTLLQVSERAGGCLSVAQLSKLELGHRRTTVQEFAAIAAAMDTSPGQILSDIGLADRLPIDPEAVQTGLHGVLGIVAAVSRAVQVGLVTFGRTRLTITRYADRDAPDITITPSAAPLLVVLDDGTAAIAFGNDTLHLTSTQLADLTLQVREHDRAGRVGAVT